MRFLAWHCGLGDSIAFAELAVVIANGEELTVPCWATNEVSVNSIFIHYPNIQVRVVESDYEVQTLARDPNAIRIGHYSGIPRKEGEDMVEWVYRTAGMDPATRFDNREVADAAYSYCVINYVPSPTGTVLIHEDIDRGFRIDRRRIPNQVRTPFVWSVNDPRMQDPTRSILGWASAIMGSSEIHCIDSSFLHLVEQLQPTGKLFYHKYARVGSLDYHFRHKWKVLQ